MNTQTKVNSIQPVVRGTHVESANPACLGMPKFTKFSPGTHNSGLCSVVSFPRY